jgi:hypothetical protein
MAIKISGTTVIDDSRNLTNIVNATATTFTGALTGNSSTATTLQTARTIGGVSFNGSANINLPGVNTAGNQNTTGSAATLQTARTINGVSFNGSANITTNPTTGAFSNGQGAKVIQSGGTASGGDAGDIYYIF